MGSDFGTPNATSVINSTLINSIATHLKSVQAHTNRMNLNVGSDGGFVTGQGCKLLYYVPMEVAVREEGEAPWTAAICTRTISMRPLFQQNGHLSWRKRPMGVVELLGEFRGQVINVELGDAVAES
jgi:hypothetical protein